MTPDPDQDPEAARPDDAMEETTMPEARPGRGAPRRIPGWGIILALVLAAGATLTIVAVTIANEAPIAAPPGGPAASAAASTPSPSPTPTSAPSGGSSDVSAFCRANGAAARALQGTVAEDLRARREQLDVTRELLPLTDVPAEVAAGADVFVRAAEENIGILEDLPGSTLVADLPLDTFTGTQSMADLATNTDYQAFIGWTIETCGIGLVG